MSKRWTDINESLEDVRNQNDAYSFDSDMNDLDIHFSISEAISFAAESKYIAEGLYRDMLSFNKKAEEKGYDTMEYIAEAFSIGGIFKRIVDFLYKIWSNIVNFFKGLFKTSTSGGSSYSKTTDDEIKKVSDEIIALTKELNKAMETPQLERSDKSHIMKLEMLSHNGLTQNMIKNTNNIRHIKDQSDVIKHMFSEAFYKFKGNVSSENAIKNLNFKGNIISEETYRNGIPRGSLLEGLLALMNSDSEENNAISMHTTKRIVSTLTRMINSNKFDALDGIYKNIASFHPDDVAKFIINNSKESSTIPGFDVSNVKTIEDVFKHMDKDDSYFLKFLNSNSKQTSDINLFINMVDIILEDIDSGCENLEGMLKDTMSKAHEILYEIDAFKTAVNSIGESDSNISTEDIAKINTISSKVMDIQVTIQKIIISLPLIFSRKLMILLEYVTDRANELYTAAITALKESK